MSFVDQKGGFTLTQEKSHRAKTFSDFNPVTDTLYYYI